MDPGPNRVLGALADRAQPVDRARERELGRPESVHEVAAADPSGFLHRPQHGVDRAEPTDHALSGDGFAGQHAMSFEEGERQGMSALGRGRKSGRGPDQRPAAGGLRRPEAGQPTRTPTGLAPGSRPAQRPEWREGVVGHLAGPDQVPQRVEHLAIRPAAGSEVDLPVERCAPASEERPDRLVTRCAWPLGRRGLDATRTADRPERFPAGSEERDPPIVPAEAPPPHPGHLTERPELVEQTRLVAGDAGRQDVALEDRGRDRQTGQLVDDLGQPLEGRRAAQRRRRLDRAATQPRQRSDALPVGQEPTEGGRVDRLDPRRSRASDRRRSWRRTSGSHHSRSAPPGRNSPRRSVPAAIRRPRASSTTPIGNAQRIAGSGVRNGPWVRAKRDSSPSRAAVV